MDSLQLAKENSFETAQAVEPELLVFGDQNDLCSVTSKLELAKDVTSLDLVLEHDGVSVVNHDIVAVLAHDSEE